MRTTALHKRVTRAWAYKTGRMRENSWGGRGGDKERIKAPEVNCGCHTSFHTVQIPKCWTQVGDYDTAVPCENPVT